MVQQLLTLLFGTWFRMIYHTEVNAMSVEAVAKSVAGSIFPSCTYSPEKVRYTLFLLARSVRSLHFMVEHFRSFCALSTYN